MKRKTNKRANKKDKLKTMMESAEELSFSRTENEVEDLRYSEDFRDCFDESGGDDKNVIARVRLL